MQTYIIAIIVVIAILILYGLISWNTCAYEEYLYGFWLAEGDDFCEESDIDSMLVFIGDADRGWYYTERTCYIIIMNDLCNQGFTLTYRPARAGPGLGKYCVHADVVFDSENIWSDRVKIEIDILSGTMKISSNDIIYAKLHKQHDTTNLARQAGCAELVD